MVGLLLVDLGGMSAELPFLVELGLSLLAGSGFFPVCPAPSFPHRQDLYLDFALFAISFSSANGILF